MGTVYATMKRASRPQVKEWAQNTYPDEWAAVEKRLSDVPEDCSGEEMLERLGIGQLGRLGQQNRQAVLALEEGEKKKAGRAVDGNW